MKNLLIIGLIVLVLYVLMQKPKQQQPAPKQSTDPVDEVQEKIEDLQKAIRETFPDAGQKIDPVVNEAQRLVDEFQEELIRLAEMKESVYKPVVLTTDEMHYMPVVKEDHFFMPDSTTFSKEIKAVPEPILGVQDVRTRFTVESPVLNV